MGLYRLGAIPVFILVVLLTCQIHSSKATVVGNDTSNGPQKKGFLWSLFWPSGCQGKKTSRYCKGHLWDLGVDQAQCGKPAVQSAIGILGRARIVGGNVSSPQSWPWMVSLTNPSYTHVCGGTLIGRRWVLTAAHCMTRQGFSNISDWTVILGKYFQLLPEPTDVLRGIKRSIIHPSYKVRPVDPNVPGSFQTYENDIALLELDAEVAFSDDVRPICLQNSLRFSSRDTCAITGWGLSFDITSASTLDQLLGLREAKVPLILQRTCRRLAYGKSLIAKTMICAGYTAGGVDACRFDSGGPLQCKSKTTGRWYLTGITSWGYPACGTPGNPGVYTLVPSYHRWILSQIIAVIQTTR